MKLRTVGLTLSTILTITLLTPIGQVQSQVLGKKTCSYTHRDGPIKLPLTGPREHLHHAEVAEFQLCPSPNELVTHNIEDFAWLGNEGNTQVYQGFTDDKASEKCEVTVTITHIIGGGDPIFEPL
ncbi:MAG: hypothetical protein KUG78_07585 [Kangiellaceae bacterium]|nr:hypothetical protein [Kangiellaceae bacterium]